MFKTDYITQEVSVEEALSKGRRMLLLPRILILAGLFFFLFPIVLFIMVYREKPFALSGILPLLLLILVLTFTIEVFLPFLYWSKRTTSWKLWAFSEVRNVNELMKMAVHTSLIPREGTLLARLQIRTKSDKKKWLAVQKKIQSAR